jgi:hypothetical protein
MPLVKGVRPENQNLEESSSETIEGFSSVGLALDIVWIYLF